MAQEHRGALEGLRFLAAGSGAWEVRSGRTRAAVIASTGPSEPKEHRQPFRRVCHADSRRR